MLQHPFSLQVSQEYRFVVSESVLQQPLDKMSVRKQTYPAAKMLTNTSCFKMKKKYKSNALLTDIENLPYYMHHAVLI
jgi:hypothetical protein